MLSFRSLFVYFDFAKAKCPDLKLVNFKQRYNHFLACRRSLTSFTSNRTRFVKNLSKSCNGSIPACFSTFRCVNHVILQRRTHSSIEDLYDEQDVVADEINFNVESGERVFVIQPVLPSSKF